MVDLRIPDWLYSTRNPSPVLGDLITPNSTQEEEGTFIYGLVDPETGAIRYVGKSIRPCERLKNHMNERSNCHRSHWLQSLKNRGLTPGLVILEHIIGEWPWRESERFWIAHGKQHGWPLTNNTDGGDGVCGLPPETRMRIAQTWIGRKHSPETIEKLRRARRKRTTSLETRIKMSRSQKGRIITWGDALSKAIRSLSDGDVKTVLAMLSEGCKVKDVASAFGVHRTTISKVKKGRYYERYRSAPRS